MNRKKIVMGILAHVDAGKTTLAESILYLSGNTRKLGRVDHKDAFLDTHELERARGITIFSKQAEITLDYMDITLLDTPGHMDFSAEMERTLQVLDYAVLVINGSDGIQGHVETLWRLLEQYQIPVFLFINKMDQQGAVKEELLQELKKRLDDRCIDFNQSILNESKCWEDIAMCDEELLEQYLERGTMETEDIQRLIAKRGIFPCYFGSALKLEGVMEFIEGIQRYSENPEYPSEFGARVYKIGRDERGTRLTYMKILGGELRVKTSLTGQSKNCEKWTEKIDQIRIYSGSSYEVSDVVHGGDICAVAGLSHTYCGEGIGKEMFTTIPMLYPVLSYRIILPPEQDVHQAFFKFRELEEEEPLIHLVWDEQSDEIHVQLMGDIQMEILKSVVLERFHISITFGPSSIVYKETVSTPIEGVGHFEPLRHYAEVHLLLEPAERGSGITVATACSEDLLDRNWQRLILGHLQEKKHQGVLAGAELTDVKITLLCGRGHQKHTEGGDFRQATYRAVRHGLMRGNTIILEPVYEYRLEVPEEMIGRALADIQRMQGTFSQPEQLGDMAVLKGKTPVATMQGYYREVLTYTKGRGRLFCQLSGYEPCYNQEQIIAAIGYDAQSDVDNPADSVFCAQGAGFVVPWDQVDAYMHLDYAWKSMEEHISQEYERENYKINETFYDEKELTDIFERTYGTIQRKKNGWQKTVKMASADAAQYKGKQVKKKEQYLLVDGYNIIHGWQELKEVMLVNIEGARNKLLDILCNYQGYKKNKIIVVFDAYKVSGNVGVVSTYNNIHVVFTKEAETADQYIERTVQNISGKYDVTVATSDALEQMIILGQGAARLSAQGLKEEVALVEKEIREQYVEQYKDTKQPMFEKVSEEVTQFVEVLKNE